MSTFSLFRIRRKFVRLFVGIAALGALAACEPASFGTGGGAGRPGEPVPVALLVPGGSERATDTLLASNLENAARLAMSSLNGVEIDLRVYNTAGDPEIAAAQANTAVRDGARIILGPLYSQAANATGVAVRNSGVNVLSFSNNPAIAGGNVFTLGFTFRNTANRLAGYARQAGASRMVLVHADDANGQASRDAVAGAVDEQGISILSTVSYPLSQQGVINTVSTVRDSVDATGANAVFLTSPASGALPLFAQLLPEVGVNPEAVQYIGLTRWDVPPQTLDLTGLENGWFAVPDPARETAFRSRYEETYGAPPHPLAGLAFDGIAAIGALAAQNPSTTLSGAELTQSAGFQGATGIFRLRPDGTNERGLSVATIRERQVVIIDPAPVVFSSAGF